MVVAAHGQELNAKITINHNQINGTDASVFDNLQQTLTSLSMTDNGRACSLPRTSASRATSISR